MTTGGKENDVAGAELAAFQISSIVLVEVDAQPAAPQEQDFVGEMHGARHRIMNMRMMTWPDGWRI